MSEDGNAERDAMTNRLFARVSALERLVCEHVGAQWTPERVTLWAEKLNELNDATISPSERGRADMQEAFDRLATRLLQASRREFGR